MLILGIQTSQDAHFYALSAHFEPFSNEGKPLVIQFTVKHEQKIDCGGGYVKLFPDELDQSDMHGDSQYYIMFGESWRDTEAWNQNMMFFHLTLSCSKWRPSFVIMVYNHIIMWPVYTGPDICGYSTKKVHVIINYKGQNHLIKKDIKCKVAMHQDC